MRGSRTVCKVGHVSSRDHPRACGAHVQRNHASVSAVGSSPRMRGSRWHLSGTAHVSGIIPAHAGLTYLHLTAAVAVRDHPRACGAHVKDTFICVRRMGSSPRMRGSLIQPAIANLQAGIIPAHAGLTLKNPNNDAILSVSNPIFYSVLRVIL